MAANKIKRRDYKTELLGKAEALLSKSPLGGETYASDGTCAASDIEGRFIELGERVKSAIGRAQTRALGDEKMKAGKWTPWIHGDTPTERVDELLRRRHLNERVIAYLEGELAAHVVLGDKLERELRSASDLLRKETRELGSCVETMAQKMEDLGLLAKAAQGIPKWELSAIVEFINKRKTPEGKAALEILLGGRDARVEDEFRAFDERQAWRSTNPSPSAATEPERVPLPVVPDDYEPEWTTLDEPVPLDFWSQFQVFDSNYRWQYSFVNTPADAEVASMPLPPADTYERLRSYRDDLPFVPPKPLSQTAVRKLVTVFLKHGTGQHDIEPEEGLVKAWMWLIHGRSMDAAECDRFYGEGFFEGVSMSCPATGMTVVRTLRKKAAAS